MLDPPGSFVTRISDPPLISIGPSSHNLGKLQSSKTYNQQYELATLDTASSSAHLREDSPLSKTMEGDPLSTRSVQLV